MSPQVREALREARNFIVNHQHRLVLQEDRAAAEQVVQAIEAALYPEPGEAA